MIIIVFGSVASLMVASCGTTVERGLANCDLCLPVCVSYDLIKDVGTLFGAMITILFVMKNMHREYHYKSRAKSSEYMSAWHSTEFSKLLVIVNQLKKDLFWDKHATGFDPVLFNKCHSVVADYKKNADGIEILQRVQSDILKRLASRKYTDAQVNIPRGALDEQQAIEKHAVSSLLNFFEHMGLDVKNKVADSDYLKDIFYDVLVDTYELFRKYIEYVQIVRSSRMVYCNLIFLAQTWEKEGDLPALPRICERPPVITSEDMETL